MKSSGCLRIKEIKKEVMWRGGCLQCSDVELLIWLFNLARGCDRSVYTVQTDIYAALLWGGELPRITEQRGQPVSPLTQKNTTQQRLGSHAWVLIICFGFDSIFYGCFFFFFFWNAEMHFKSEHKMLEM